MTSVLFWLAAVTLTVWVAGGLEMIVGNRSVGFLRDVPPVDDEVAPRVSMVIAARDEERNIEKALRSVLAQRYPALEVIVVNDRSADATGTILERMQQENSRLRVIHLSELPPGWLGKNHALQRGAEEAGGELLLFTDADIVIQPSAIARAVGYMQRNGTGHLAIAPELVMPSWLLDLFAGTFSIFFAQYAKPWKARDPRSKRHVGIGAFNLVRTQVYRSVGGHETIRMRPDDDLKLGKIIKQHGFPQDLLFGRGMVSVEWYASLWEAVRGLEKNSFAGVGYSVAAVVASTAVLLLLNVWPFAAVFATSGTTQLLYALVVLVIVALYAESTRASGSNPLLGVLFPVATLFILFIMWRSMLLALRNRGIDWRGTHYPLEELRANRV